MNNIINKKNLFLVLSMFLFSSSNVSASELPIDTLKVICSFLNQKNIFKNLALSCQDFKKATDEYISAFKDGRPLDVYYSPENGNSVQNLLAKERICHPLHLKFKKNATKKDLETFLRDDCLKKHRVEEVTLPSCKNIDVFCTGKNFFMPSFFRKIIDKTYLPHMKKVNLPNLSFVRNYIPKRDRFYHGIQNYDEGVDTNELNLIFSSNCNKVSNLDLKKNYYIKTGTWNQINWKNATNLTKLNVASTTISYEELKHICKQCKKLKSVTLGGAGFLDLSDGCRLEKNFLSISFYYVRSVS